MTEVLLARHAKSFANERDVAFTNEESPLNGKGIGQTRGMNRTFKDVYGITPEAYDRLVATSAYVRPQQTARLVGFRHTVTTSLINEAAISPDMLGKGHIIKKHQQEHWVPEELEEKANTFIEQVRSGEMEYQIYFTHGFFIASVIDRLAAEHQARGEESPYVFDETRGFIPELATITPVTM